MFFFEFFSPFRFLQVKKFARGIQYNLIFLIFDHFCIFCSESFLYLLLENSNSISPVFFQIEIQLTKDNNQNNLQKQNLCTKNNLFQLNFDPTEKKQHRLFQNHNIDKVEKEKFEKQNLDMFVDINAKKVKKLLQKLKQHNLVSLLKLQQKFVRKKQSITLKMSAQRNNISKLSIYDPFSSRMGSGRSYDRFTSRSNSPANMKGFSFFDANDIQVPQRKNDLYQSVLGDYNRHTNQKASLSLSQSEFFPLLPVQSTEMQMTSECDDGIFHSGQKNFHQCNCTQLQCNQQHCNCYLYPNEPCVVGLCCPKCIKLKNEYLTKQNEVQQSPSYPGCLCKTIKCLKLYCTCFREGRKCNPKVCKCEGCQNDVSSLLLRKQRKIELEIKKDNQSSGSISRRQNFLLYSEKSTQLPIEKGNYSFINCSCKKSHCLKKYCSCFMHNKSCSQACACEQCRNTYDENDQRDERNRKALQVRQDVNYWGKFYYQNNHYQNEIDQYLERDDSWFYNQEMNENMEFEPVNLQVFMTN